MKIINRETFIVKLAGAIEYASFHLREDVKAYFAGVEETTKDISNKEVVHVFQENAEIAKQESRGVCQDTGYVQIYITMGGNTQIDFNLHQAANTVIAEAYERDFLRKSLANPVTRENTLDNTPAFIDIELVDGDDFDVTVMIKGGGSENLTKAGFLLPTSSKDDIINWVVDGVRAAGSKGCPPYLIGVGIGGTLAKALYYSKKQLIESIYENRMDMIESDIANRILEKVNELPIGFQGLRFSETAMGVKVKTMSCHIATLPIAMSIGCNAIRQGNFSL